MLQTVKTRSLFTNSLNMLKSHYIKMFAKFTGIRERLCAEKTVLWDRLSYKSCLLELQLNDHEKLII